MQRQVSLQLRIVGAIIGLAAWLIRREIKRRLGAGKEIPHRINERFGMASVERPTGKLLWLHGASLGETASLLPIVTWFLAKDPTNPVLITSVSRSSSETLSQTLPERAVHQLLPGENGAWIERFLQHWRPDALVLAEQELWPRLLIKVAQARVPSLLVNARLSESSFKRWRRLVALGVSVPSLVSEVHAQNPDQADKFKALRVQSTRATGNLKFAHVTTSQRRSKSDLGYWTVVFAMSHAEEEVLASPQLRQALDDHQELCVIHCPRHIERLGSDDRRPKWSQGARPGPNSREVVVDVYGVMSQVYAESDVVILGGSFTDRVGGHSPIEALVSGAPVIVGPDHWAQQSIGDSLAPSGAVILVSSVSEAVAKALALRKDPEMVARQLKAFEQQSREGEAALTAAQAWIAKAIEQT